MTYDDDTAFLILEVLSGCYANRNRPWGAGALATTVPRKTIPGQYCSGCDTESSQDTLAKNLTASFAQMDITVKPESIFVAESRAIEKNEPARFRVIVEDDMLDALDADKLFGLVQQKSNEAKIKSTKPDGRSGRGEYIWQARAQKCSQLLVLLREQNIKGNEINPGPSSN